MFIETMASCVRPPLGGPCGYSASRRHSDSHGPPDGGRFPFRLAFYEHGPPDGGRCPFRLAFYKHGPPDGGRFPFRLAFYKHGPPGGGRMFKLESAVSRLPSVRDGRLTANWRVTQRTTPHVIADDALRSDFARSDFAMSCRDDESGRPALLDNGQSCRGGLARRAQSWGS